MTTALFPGRFDPFHRGHLFQIVNILQDIDYLIVAIRSTGDEVFTLGERLQIAVKSLELLRDVTIVDINKLDYRYDLVYTGNPDVAAMFPPAQVVSIPRWPGYSATEIRRRLGEGEDISGLVCYGAAEMIQRFWGGRLDKLNRAL